MPKPAIRMILAALLVVAVSAGAAGAASIRAGSGLAGSATTVESSADRTTSAKASANFTGVLNGDGLLFAWECDGQALGLAAATSMTACYLETGGARHHALTRINLPGNVVASAQTRTLAFADIGPTVRVCAQVEVLPVLGGPLSATACVDEGVAVNPDGVTDLLQVPADVVEEICDGPRDGKAVVQRTICPPR
jgi:hypothetical protein